MPPEVMFVAMTGIICTFLVIRMGMNHAARKLNADSSAADGGRLETILTETQKEVAQLRDRVQVLEKLVTDDDRRLASEIERLRGEARR
jgi:uncharacterized protein YlxW (UPF0749 family)